MNSSKYGLLNSFNTTALQNLVTALQRAHDISLIFFNSLDDEKKQFPVLDNLNPPLWEISHVAWFHEFWMHRRGNQDTESMLINSDSFFNSSLVAHDSRWTLPTPSESTLLNYFTQVNEKTIDYLKQAQAKGTLTEEDLYFAYLCLSHHNMHNEAFAYTFQFLGYPCPQLSELMPDLLGELNPSFNHQGFVKKDLIIDMCQVELGSKPGQGFIFDNEKWAHWVSLGTFAISNTAVTNEEYLEYLTEMLRVDPAFDSPPYWQLQGGGSTWMERHFDTWSPLDMKRPVRHISKHAAQGFARWAGRRLPSEAELVRLYSEDKSLWQASNLWEWTDSFFNPFEGFTADPYADYSKPWFGNDYVVMKGFSAWTSPELRRTQFRNFYNPSRYDPFCGFRTCVIKKQLR